jgi:propanol-preferring alcohol dehydrogenase
MQAVQITAPGQIDAVEVDVPTPGPGQVLLRVHACGVCRTDLHLLDGEVVIPAPPIVPGHQIVATIAAGDEAGLRVGVPWLAWACGECRYCRSGQENLCPRARFTGRDVNGGFAQYAVAERAFCLELPASYGDLEIAPLLCGGLIGYRALRIAGDGERVGLYGFGAAAHIIAQVVQAQGRRVFAFTRDGDARTQEFARGLGAAWAGGSGERPPEELDCALVFAAAGELVPAALRAVRPGGSVVCAGIHMSEIPAFPYEILWGERTLRSVANLTRRDGREMLELAARTPIVTAVSVYALANAAAALNDLRAGRFDGAAVVDLAVERTVREGATRIPPG